MKFIISILIALGLAISVAAQSPSKVLKQAEKALGGAKALRTIRSVSETGRIVRLRDAAAGRYESQTARPNLFSERFDINGFEIETGANGRSGWTRNSRDGLQTLTGDGSSHLQTKAAFRNDLWLNYKNEKSRIVSGGAASVGGKPVNLLVLTTSKGVTVKLFFDAVSGLPLRDEILKGDLSEVREYGDYREMGGTRRPFFQRLSVGGETYEIRLDDIRANQNAARSVFDFPNISGQPLPDIPTLLKDLQANEDKVEAILDTYSFVQKIIKRELGKDGVLRETESETYQMSFYKGNRMRRLIEKNGRALSEKEQADEDKEAGKRVEEIEKRVAKREAKQGSEDAEDRRISIAEMLRASRLLNPRRERFRGREVIVFDFEPDPAFDMKKAKSMMRFFGKTAGVMWIDEQDKQVARLEASLSESFGIGGGVLAKLKKGASFSLEQERVNDEIWLPSQADINLSVRVLLVKGIDLNQVIKSYNYRKFETEVKDARVNPTP